VCRISFSEWPTSFRCLFGFLLIVSAPATSNLCSLSFPPRSLPHLSGVHVVMFCCQMLIRFCRIRQSGFHFFGFRNNFFFYRARSSALRPTQPGGLDLCIYVLQGQGGPVIPSGTGFLLVVFYDSQGYGGGILTRLHTGRPSNGHYKSTLNSRSAGLSMSEFRLKTKKYSTEFKIIFSKYFVSSIYTKSSVFWDITL
jgi:hypothetical protein